MGTLPFDQITLFKYENYRNDLSWKKMIHILHTENTQKLVHFELIIVPSMENAFTENK